MMMMMMVITCGYVCKCKFHRSVCLFVLVKHTGYTYGLKTHEK